MRLGNRSHPLRGTQNKQAKVKELRPDSKTDAFDNFSKLFGRKKGVSPQTPITLSPPQQTVKYPNKPLPFTVFTKRPNEEWGGEERTRASL